MTTGEDAGTVPATVGKQGVKGGPFRHFAEKFYLGR